MLDLHALNAPTAKVLDKILRISNMQCTASCVPLSPQDCLCAAAAEPVEAVARYQFGRCELAR